MKRAEYWKQGEAGRILCKLCPHRCVLTEGQTGSCRVRLAKGGELLAAGYGRLSSSAVDPIEKKPLYHFHPGAEIFSIGGWGCNLGCAFCQNWTISQRAELSGPEVSPDWIVGEASRLASIGIAYTYNEPLISFEFVRDCAVLAREHNLVNVLVTNGFIERAPAEALLPLIDALNIDVKSMEDSFYRRVCGGRLKPVLRFAEQARRADCHVEITNLVIPGYNDDEENLAALGRWVAETLGRTTPLHLSAYRPMYRMTAPPTSLSGLLRAHEICSEWLDYVYLGNVLTETGSHTLCPACGAMQVVRNGYSVQVVGVRHGVCTGCGRKADIVF